MSQTLSPHVHLQNITGAGLVSKLENLIHLTNSFTRGVSCVTEDDKEETLFFAYPL